MPAPRVLVLTASMGEGHIGVARELARRVSARGADARVVDLLELPRFGQGRALRGFYRLLVGRLPAAYDLAMRGWEAHPRLFERITAAGHGAYDAPLLELVDGYRPDVVVATYNLAAQLAARLRERGRLPARLISHVTDPGAHPYWVARAADVHTALLPETARALRGYGAGAVVVVAPPVRPGFTRAPARSAARRTLGVPLGARVAVVNAGSWAVGAIEDTVRRLARLDDVVPMVLCGRDEALRRRLGALELGLPLGWGQDMPAALAAADVVVDNAGGQTCWEALVVGRPVVLHAPVAGHGRLNAAALEDAGLVTWARDPCALGAAVRTAEPPERARRLLDAPGLDDVVLAR